MNNNNIKLVVSYDGTRFFGWQKTETGPSIEEELEKALKRILRHDVQLDAASRTDRGVHAEGQPVRFFSSREVNLHRLVRGLNAVLPVEISVRSAQLMPLDFHPTIHALGKEYHYHLCLGSAQIPMHRFYSWHVPLTLDFEKMEEAVQLLLGKRDFSAFSNAPVVRRNPAPEGGVLQKEKDPTCDLQKIEFFQKEGRLIIALRADRFLYKMVRNLVGALIYIGCGKLDVGAIPSLLESRDRSKGAVTAPARGLFLSEVFYDFSK